MRHSRLLSAILIGFIADLVAAGAGAAGCDEDNPNGPMRSGVVTLTSSDSVVESRSELRTFVVTGSLGRVDAAIVTATPLGAVSSVGAVPHLSRFTPDYGEQLKGVEVTAALKGADRSVKVVVRLRQVCAEYFRDSFLSQ